MRSLSPTSQSPATLAAGECDDAAEALDRAARVVERERPESTSSPLHSLREAAVRFAGCVREAGLTPEAMLRHLKARLWPSLPGEDPLHFQVVREAIHAYFHGARHR